MSATDATRRLAALQREVQRLIEPPAPGRRSPGTRRAGRWTWRRAVLALLRIGAIVALPFLLYVRASVWLYLRAGFSPWLSVIGASVLTVGVVTLYATWLSRRIAGGARAPTAARVVALPLTIAWCGYSALYLARVNAKSEDVRSYYGSVHPVLRVALATAILGDPAVVVTDMARVAADYQRMRLPVNERTRHYRQPNGWVHAADLRVIGHGELRNRALQAYFWAMGFQTLRHVGTADHLHVQLPVR